MEVTKEIAEQAFAAIKKQFAAYIDENNGPELIENWDWLDSGPTPWAVVWEEGPFEWAYRAQTGGRDYEATLLMRDATGDQTKVVDTPEAEGWPEGFFTEAVTSWAVGIYPV